MKRLVLSILISLTLALAAAPGQALAAFATADAVIDWNSLTFSSAITWDEQESYVETMLGNTSTSQQADGFVTLLQTAFDANTDVLAGTLDGSDGAFVNAGASGDGYAYTELYGVFTPEADMTLTITFDYDLFGEISGAGATSYSSIFLILDDEIFEEALALEMSGGTDTLTGAASVTANLLEGVRYEFNLGAMSEASALPVPPAVWLLGSGLIGFVGVRRRR